DLERDPLRGQCGRGVARVVDADAVRDDADVPPRSIQARPADRDRLVRRWLRLAVAPVALLMLEEQHRIVVPDRALEQALRVARGGRHDHLQARYVAVERFDAL